MNLDVANETICRGEAHCSYGNVHVYSRSNGIPLRIKVRQRRDLNWPVRISFSFLASLDASIGDEDRRLVDATFDQMRTSFSMIADDSHSSDSNC